MFYIIIALFVIGYIFIALEQKLSINKASIALIAGSLIWVCLAFSLDSQEVQSTLFKHLASISELLFLIIGSMTIIEIIDSHGGFSMFTDIIKTIHKAKLIWIFSFFAFFMAAVFENLTTTIVMINLVWKLIGGKNTRWYFTGMIIIAANAGGAWSPIGDISTIILWVGGQITSISIVKQLFVPCMISMLVPLIVVSLNMKGDTIPPAKCERARSMVPTTNRERWIIFIAGICSQIFVPVFKAVTHLPPYMGMMLAVGIMVIMAEFLRHKKQSELRVRLTIEDIIKKIEIPTILFIFGILLAVKGLEAGGQLKLFGLFLEEKIHNIYVITMAVGGLSSLVDNVSLVAGTMGMYEIVTPEALAAVSDPTKAAFMKFFVQDGSFWELLAYCAGTGGSIMLIGSATGVAAMGLAKIEFMWYLKKISLLALLGFISGILAYYLIVS